MQNGEAIFDVGCADGRFLEYIKDRMPNCSLYGIDFAHNPLKLLLRGLTNNVACGDICNMPFKFNIFKYACCIQTIQQIPSQGERQKALIEIFSTLKKNSTFVLTVLNQKTWHDMVDNGKDGPLKSCPELYVYLFNPSDLQCELEKAGFIVEIIKGINNIPVKLVRRLGIIGVYLDLFITRVIPSLSLKKGTYLLAKCKKK
jgi:ubiquinone/menaquinone biosynthesis C-methylase UbiE